MMYPLLMVCGAVLLFVYILEKIRAYSVKAVIIKSVVSVLFITVGVYGSWRCAGNGTASLLCPFVVSLSSPASLSRPTLRIITKYGIIRLYIQRKETHK